MKIWLLALFLYSVQISAQEKKDISVTDLTKTDYITKQQRKELYKQMLATINQYDAEGIETRKSTKEVGWKKYTKVKRKNFIKAQNWKNLRDAFNSFGGGFVNLHSSFRFNLADEYPIIISKKITYSYPNIAFYFDETNEEINKVNGIKIDKLFKHYSNYDCNFNSTSGCLATFVDDFNFGKVLAKNKLPKAIKIKKGESINVTFKDFYGKRGKNEIKKPDVSWKPLTEGHNIELYEKGKTLLLRIKSFHYKSNNDFRCSKEIEQEKNICFDVRLIRKTLLSHADKIENLIIDLQNNGGGNENTAFIAELATKPFKDLQVLYRKTKILENKEFRTTLFWDSEKAENWFQKILNDGTYKSTAYGDFLPKRADFCQASNTCELKEIQPNGLHNFKQIILLTNQFCVSSCDDMVWRLRQFANVKVVGLPAAADGTYSRISAVFYLDTSGKIQRKLYAERSEPKVEGTTIFSIKIPYTKGVDYNHNKLIQGQSITPDLIVPINHETIKKHGLKVLKQAYLYLTQINN